MRRKFLYSVSASILCMSGLACWIVVHVRASSTPAQAGYRSEWSPAAAARYLDYREAWWQGWPTAQMEQGTVCISCHTVLPYAFARPALRRPLGQTDLTVEEKKMLSSIEKRVTAWARTAAYYPDSTHAAPSRSTEAVLNALILATYDTSAQRPGTVTRAAFENAWSLQEKNGENAGGWQWQDFHEAPWEGPESAYQGAAMMAIALGMMPGQYLNESGVRDHVQQLQENLRRHYDAQPPLNQLYVLWASAQMPWLLSDVQHEDLVQRIAGLQNADGGWSLSILDKQASLKPARLNLFKRADNVDGSDGCATGLAVLALEKTKSNRQIPVLQRGLAWLRTHQFEDGNWWASSLNEFRDPASEMGHFMSDAATGYAVLALEEDRKQVAQSVSHDTNTTELREARSSRQASRSPSAPSSLPN